MFLLSHSFQVSEKKIIISKLGEDVVSPSMEIDNMVVLELLGSGAFGSVYKAIKTTGQVIALKEVCTNEKIDFYFFRHLSLSLLKLSSEFSDYSRSSMVEGSQEHGHNKKYCKRS